MRATTLRLIVAGLVVSGFHALQGADDPAPRTTDPARLRAEAEAPRYPWMPRSAPSPERRGTGGTVVGAFYYLRIIKVMYFDAPAAPLQKAGIGLEGVLIGAAALFVSPLGYLLIGPLGDLSLNAARSLF